MCDLLVDVLLDGFRRSRELLQVCVHHMRGDELLATTGDTLEVPLAEVSHFGRIPRHEPRTTEHACALLHVLQKGAHRYHIPTAHGFSLASHGNSLGLHVPTCH